MKTVRRPPYPKWNPGYFPCSSLTPLPLSSRRPSVSFGGFGLTLVLFLVLIQGALAGKGLLPFFLVPGILIFALYMNPGLVLYLTLTLVLILATGVLMDAGPVAFLAVPLVLSLGVVVVLFHELSPGEGRKIRHLR